MKSSARTTSSSAVLLVSAAALVGAVALAPREARAEGKKGCLTALLVTSVIGVPAEIGGIVTVVGAGVTLTDNPPNAGWRNAAWTMGALNLGVTAAVIAETACGLPPIVSLAGILPLGLGVANIVEAGIMQGRADVTSSGSTGIVRGHALEPVKTWTFPVFSGRF